MHRLEESLHTTVETRSSSGKLDNSTHVSSFHEQFSDKEQLKQSVMLEQRFESFVELLELLELEVLLLPESLGGPLC